MSKRTQKDCVIGPKQLPFSELARIFEKVHVEERTVIWRTVRHVCTGMADMFCHREGMLLQCCLYLAVIARLGNNREQHE